MSDRQNPEAPAVLTAALQYRALGLSVLPLGPASKEPLEGFKRWAKWQRQIANEQDIIGWFAREQAAGVGIVAGEVSRNARGESLAVLDVDDADFSTWLEEKAADQVLRKTWTVRTGSGKLHVYCYTRIPARTTTLPRLTTTGNKLADIRGSGKDGHGGSYVAAPPSRHPRPARRTPRSMATRPGLARGQDTQQLFEALRALYEGELVANPDLTDCSLMEPLTPVTGRLWSGELHELGDGRIIRAVIEGATPQEGEWTGSKTPSGSEVDYAVSNFLVEHGFLAAEVEAIFATFPVGANCYRRLSRPSHGHAYLMQTMKGSLRERGVQEEAAKLGLGKNFRITKVEMVLYNRRCST